MITFTFMHLADAFIQATYIAFSITLFIKQVYDDKQGKPFIFYCSVERWAVSANINMYAIAFIPFHER